MTDKYSVPACLPPFFVRVWLSFRRRLIPYFIGVANKRVMMKRMTNGVFGWMHKYIVIGKGGFGVIEEREGKRDVQASGHGARTG